MLITIYNINKLLFKSEKSNMNFTSVKLSNKIVPLEHNLIRKSL